MLLADLSASGVPVDAASIAAAVVADGVAAGSISIDTIHKELGMEVRYHTYALNQHQASIPFKQYDGWLPSKQRARPQLLHARVHVQNVHRVAAGVYAGA
jgi:hypothetical protein